ncbi:Ger(x)C family spore germination protein [Paenibacillus cymbidii]|uniref:Ger(x)C family spore germination protein n=1 Tax=Paenibacillus cymbidii TaxID=1639034 RepID=UPI00107FF2C8|nr:Ger(x)C family spore germination protein [Paenibacillus cymbidii]
MRMRKPLLAVLLIGICAMVAGCSFKDIDKRFFVVAMGIDWTGKTDTPYLVTLRIAVPTTKFGEGLAESQIEQLEAPTIAEAVRNLKAHVDKELDFGHCKVFLFGDEMVNHSMLVPLSWLSRRRDIQLISYMAVARPSANKMLKDNPTTERIAGNSFLLMFGKEGTVSPYTVTEYLFDSVRRFKETGLDPILPIVTFDGNSYVVERLSLLDKKSERLELDAEETKLYNLSANAFARSGIPADFRGKRIVLYVAHASRNVSITKENIPTIKLKLRISGMIEQSDTTFNPSTLKEAQRALEKSVNENTMALLTKIRDAGVDPYGFGLHYLAQYFGSERDWQHWQEVYPQVKFEVDAHVTIESTGLIR